MHNKVPCGSTASFQDFLKQVFYTVNPGGEFISSWHISLLAEYLKNLESSKINRLIVNIPPRSLKSICISVAWPAWILGHDPTKRIIVASYSHALAIKHSMDARAVMQSDWYKQMFPLTVIAKGSNTQRKFVTTQRGFRYATSVGGTLTGEGADVIILDDPQTPAQANNLKGQRRVNDWYDQTLSSRLNSRKDGVIALVMQRLHQNDLSSHLLSKGMFEHLKLKAIYDTNESYKINEFSHHIDSGAVLCQELCSANELKQLQLEMGSFAFNAQYMQEPLKLDSDLFRTSWVKRYTEVPEDGQIFQSWDCASKAGINNDYSVCTTWKIHNNDFYLIDVIRQKLTYVDLRKLAIEHAKNYSPEAVLIEDMASGQQLIQELRSILPQAVIPISPRKDKVTRALSISPLFEAGRVFLPINQHWLMEYETELFLFPNVSHDDQVDSSTQFLKWAVNRGREACVRYI